MYIYIAKRVRSVPRQTSELSAQPMPGLLYVTIILLSLLLLSLLYIIRYYYLIIIVIIIIIISLWSQ